MERSPTEEGVETKLISTCASCPMHVRMGNGSLCAHWGSPEYNHIPFGSGVPDWCPLRRKSLLLKLEKG